MIDKTLAELEAEIKSLKVPPAKKAALNRKLAALKREVARLEKVGGLAKDLQSFPPPELTNPRVLETIDAIARELAALGI